MIVGQFSNKLAIKSFPHPLGKWIARLSGYTCSEFGADVVHLGPVALGTDFFYGTLGNMLNALGQQGFGGSKWVHFELFPRRWSLAATLRDIVD